MTNEEYLHQEGMDRGECDAPNTGFGEQKLDLDHLEEAAKAATPGPWMSDGLSNVRCTNNDHICVVLVSPTFTGRTPTPEDAAFIASANPATVLELVAEFRKVRAERDWLANDIATKDGNCPPIPQDCTDIVFCSPDVCKQCWLNAAREAVEKEGKE